MAAANTKGKTGGAQGGHPFVNEETMAAVYSSRPHSETVAV